MKCSGRQNGENRKNVEDDKRNIRAPHTHTQPSVSADDDGERPEEKNRKMKWNKQQKKEVKENQTKWQNERNDLTRLDDKSANSEYIVCRRILVFCTSFVSVCVCARLVRIRKSVLYVRTQKKRKKNEKIDSGFGAFISICHFILFFFSARRPTTTSTADWRSNECNYFWMCDARATIITS